MRRSVLVSFLLVSFTGLLAAMLSPPPGTPVAEAQSPSWPAYGGPRGDFTVADAGIARRWETAPPRLWERDFSVGYSAISSDGATLYTMYSDGDRETVVAIDAGDGSTLWERGYASSREGLNLEYGPGPHAAPAISGDRLLTASARGVLKALDRSDGSELWSRDLWQEYDGTVRNRGYSSSPIVWNDTVIAMVGGEGRTVMAFDLADGRELWRGGDFDNAHSTPRVIEVDGRPVVVGMTTVGVGGWDARTGEPLWDVDHVTNYGLNISMPVTLDEDRLFVSAAYGNGGRAVSLRTEGEGIVAEEDWFNAALRLHFGSALYADGTIYLSSGDFGPSVMTAADAADGEILWRSREFAKASLVGVGDLTILLDEEGALGLVRLSPEGMEVLGRDQLFEERAWTAPTIVGTRLFARTNERMVAVDLGVR